MRTEMKGFLLKKMYGIYRWLLETGTIYQLDCFPLIKSLHHTFPGIFLNLCHEPYKAYLCENVM